MGAKINLLAMAAAVGAFFLPWLEVSCSAADGGSVTYQQTGSQAVTGKVGLVEGVTAPSVELDASVAGSFQFLKPAVLAGAAAVLVGLGLLFGFVAVGGEGGNLPTAVVAALALALLGLQMAVRFPVEKEIPSPRDLEGWEPAVAEMGREPQIAKVRYLTGLYVELGALAVPVAVLIGGVFRKKSRPADDPFAD